MIDAQTDTRVAALWLRLFGVSCLALMTVLVKLASESGLYTKDH